SGRYRGRLPTTEHHPFAAQLPPRPVDREVHLARVAHRPRPTGHRHRPGRVVARGSPQRRRTGRPPPLPPGVEPTGRLTAPVASLLHLHVVSDRGSSSVAPLGEDVVRHQTESHLGLTQPSNSCPNVTARGVVQPTAFGKKNRPGKWPYRRGQSDSPSGRPRSGFTAREAGRTGPDR